LDCGRRGRLGTDRHGIVGARCYQAAVRTQPTQP
jgi:hypothetical protein